MHGNISWYASLSLVHCCLTHRHATMEVIFCEPDFCQPWLQACPWLGVSVWDLRAAAKNRSNMVLDVLPDAVATGDVVAIAFEQLPWDGCAAATKHAESWGTRLAVLTAQAQVCLCGHAGHQHPLNSHRSPLARSMHAHHHAKIWQRFQKPQVVWTRLAPYTSVPGQLFQMSRQHVIMKSESAHLGASRT